MAAKRISKSAIDWVKFSELVPEFEKPRFLALKARSDLYQRRVQNYPENPPAINWNEYRSKINNKAIVDQLEKAYASVKIPYPEDTVSATVDAQEKSCESEMVEYSEWAQNKIKQAEALKYKFEIMIPYDKMTQEEFTLTFPDWNVTMDAPSEFPHPQKAPGLSRKEREEIAKDPVPHFYFP